MVQCFIVNHCFRDCLRIGVHLIAFFVQPTNGLAGSWAAAGAGAWAELLAGAGAAGATAAGAAGARCATEVIDVFTRMSAFTSWNPLLWCQRLFTHIDELKALLILICYGCLLQELLLSRSQLLVLELQVLLEPLLLVRENRLRCDFNDYITNGVTVPSEAKTAVNIPATEKE